MTIGRPNRLRFAELTSGVGALVLGIGIGAFAGERLGGLALLLLLAGAAVHAWGMFDKHRLDRNADAPDVWWAPYAYWTCWVLLGLAVLGTAGRVSGLL